MTARVEEVKRITRELLDEFGPNYVYPRAQPTDDGQFGECLYAERAEDGTLTPSCIVGQIAYRLDPDGFKALAALERPDNDPVRWELQLTLSEDYEGITDTTQIVSKIVGEPTGPMDDYNKSLTAALFSAQARQDTAQPWGKAAEYILDYNPED